ncbi:Sjogren's syndrome/scleroderma autoantigen 1 family protein [Natronomonas sp. LN261]|uniref:Sjogren's syndrome/scleroderma autoantigen 1 family protein n=1 Tax=Natronomonas sp. LN261 TaxID=2750669 RepID=UPI0015EF616F|nr:Sjogren's syndrome/scleroderma autoantigen 1 family protein [Natronomonas sp. LN261]
MSDFDREAEREKLREKYERDKQKREASEQMSELLLQGATMTNRHCPECHSPVFRYEGQEFCPTCQKEITEEGELLDDEDETGTQPETEGTDADAPDADADAPDADAPDADADAPDADAPDADADAPDADADAPDADADAPDAEPESDRSTVESGRAPERDSASGSPPTPARDRRPARVDPPARRETGTTDEASGRDVTENRVRTGQPGSERGQLREAERTLVDEITSLTRRAEETRDVGRKRDLLAAAREAAETLETVRRL